VAKVKTVRVPLNVVEFVGESQHYTPFYLSYSLPEDPDDEPNSRLPSGVWDRTRD
jgi:hypothetical protein